MTNPIITQEQRRIVIERLQAALLEVALCETWLALNAPALACHQSNADYASNRAFQLTQMEGTQR